MRRSIFQTWTSVAAGHPGTWYVFSVLRAAATCLFVLTLVVAPWAVSYRGAATRSPDAALRSAIAEGDTSAMARAVAAGARVDGGDALELSPLAEAVVYRRPDAVRWLLEHGADANEPVVRRSAPPLFLAIGCPDATFARLLLDAGADPDARMPVGGVTPLSAACARGEEDGMLDVVDALLAAGADPDAPDARGERPLAIATESGHTRVAQRLVAAAAARRSRNVHGPRR